MPKRSRHESELQSIEPDIQHPIKPIGNVLIAVFAMDLAIHDVIYFSLMTESLRVAFSTRYSDIHDIPATKIDCLFICNSVKERQYFEFEREDEGTQFAKVSRERKLSSSPDIISDKVIIVNRSDIKNCLIGPKRDIALRYALSNDYDYLVQADNNVRLTPPFKLITKISNHLPILPPPLKRMESDDKVDYPIIGTKRSCEDTNPIKNPYMNNIANIWINSCYCSKDAKDSKAYITDLFYTMINPNNLVSRHRVNVDGSTISQETDDNDKCYNGNIKPLILGPFLYNLIQTLENSPTTVALGLNRHTDMITDNYNNCFFEVAKPKPKAKPKPEPKAKPSLQVVRSGSLIKKEVTHEKLLPKFFIYKVKALPPQFSYDDLPPFRVEDILIYEKFVGLVRHKSCLLYAQKTKPYFDKYLLYEYTKLLIKVKVNDKVQLQKSKCDFIEADRIRYYTKMFNLIHIVDGEKTWFKIAPTTEGLNAMPFSLPKYIKGKKDNHEILSFDPGDQIQLNTVLEEMEDKINKSRTEFSNAKYSMHWVTIIAFIFTYLLIFNAIKYSSPEIEVTLETIENCLNVLDRLRKTVDDQYLKNDYRAIKYLKEGISGIIYTGQIYAKFNPDTERTRWLKSKIVNGTYMKSFNDWMNSDYIANLTKTYDFTEDEEMKRQIWWGI